ncbi:hypothetical protein D1872_227540 [compost metagenome]
MNSFTRRYLEKLMIKVINMVQYTAPLTYALARLVHIHCIISLHIPAIRRKFPNRVYTFFEVIPKLVIIISIWKTA